MIIKLVKLTSIVMVMLLVFLAVTLRLGFETNHFESFQIVLSFTCGFLMLIGVWYFLAPPHLSITRKSPTSLSSAPQKSVEDRLDELERLKRRDMVTPKEYATKRQEILKDL